MKHITIQPVIKWEVSEEKRNRFLKEAFTKDEDSPYNFDNDFEYLKKKYGSAYLQYLVDAYLVKDEMTDEDFSKMNGNVPLNFLRNKIAR